MDPAQPPRDQLTPSSPLQWCRQFEPADISDADVTVQPEVLCEACLRVGPWLQDNRAVEESHRQPLTHSGSGQALEKAYKDGCHLCTLFWHSLVEPDVDKYCPSPEERLEERNTRAGQARGGSEVKLILGPAKPDGIHLRLKHSDELQDPATLKWVCLSYCWGGSSTLKLTRSTSPTLQHGVMADRLPKTIRDAVRVVLGLGLEFLWVDALCILQDSAEDWLHEAESMGDIYRGSFLTLAALGATDSSAGLFASRDPLIYSKCRISLQHSEVAGIYPAWSDYVPYQISVRQRVGFFLRQHDIASGPDADFSSTRGWVVQERILARRTLRFGPTLSWECWESATSELDPSERGIWDHDPEPLCSSFYQRVIDMGQPRDQNPPSENEQEEQVRELWDSIVSEFSEASLTVLLDRQAAILGLVSAIALRTGWKHVAGYWLPHTIRDLLWGIKASSIETRRTGLSPSWSWLSITGGVHFTPFTSSHDKYLAEIKGVDGEDRTVPMRLSCLRLRLGPLRDIGIHEAPEGWPSRNFFARKDMRGGLPDEVYILPLALTVDSEYTAVEGIQVTPSRLCPGAYERVGPFTHSMWNDADKAEMETVLETLCDVGGRETVILV
ncbi:heterokaryon incompatibility protein-domain-containing protein [Schizothecium vesticola]|uniref:Heterokaryon incompatibility protein-domain-containing protein n=1 Tax=Schizothecium vesticola TaxID=314040 RepID=A0AA40FC32_9PEZI|nr:heterokaryon incompatibility protein-domain-containing protein [Schizothecium vesticola]